MIPEAGPSTHPPQAAGSSVPRAFVKSLAGAAAGSLLPLDPREMHHLVHVRRGGGGASVDAFDESGLTAPARLKVDGDQAALVLLADPAAAARAHQIVVYSALPKGSRADWMVEKLAELGVAELVPLKTQRSVVDPRAGKIDRLSRIAREAAKQSRSPGAMKIAGPVSLEEALRDFATTAGRAALLTTQRPGSPLPAIRADALFIGPEGGWTDAELDMMLAAGFAAAHLTQTILRVETAAICAAAVVLASAPRAS